MFTLFFIALIVFAIYITISYGMFGITKNLLGSYDEWIKLDKDFGIFFSSFC